MSLSIDGTPVHVNFNSGVTSKTITVTTLNANDIIVIAMLNNGPVPVVSIASANTTGWAQRGSANSGQEVLWYGKAASPLTNEVITITFSGATGFTTVDCFAISGANFSSFLDPNGALPGVSYDTPASITSSNASDILVSCYRFIGTASPTAGAGWTQISGSDYHLTQYKIVAAAQTGTLATIGTGNGDQNGGVADALMANTTPVLTLPTATASVVVGATATPFADITVADADADSLSVTVTLSDAAKLVCSTLPSGWLNTSGTLFTRSGRTAAQMQTDLRLFVFTGSAAGSATITVVANDGTTNSNTVTSTVTVTASPSRSGFGLTLGLGL